MRVPQRNNCEPVEEVRDEENTQAGDDGGGRISNVDPDYHRWWYCYCCCGLLRDKHAAGATAKKGVSPYDASDESKDDEDDFEM